MIGSTLSSYRITAKLGEGGMGEVWRATDERLGREVAIKLLPESLAGDPERMARFTREARVLASLNHPNIAALHTLEEVDGKQLLVMELVGGEELSDLLRRRNPDLGEVVQIARGIAAALAEAHHAGIVHRDLKPANVRLTEDGVVKVLDFGLAKAWESSPGQGSDSLSLSPTRSHLGTATGVILGTVGYMAPEQARGLKVDQRSDVWAFGVVLWEMLSGRRLFAGATVSDVLADVLRAPVDFDAIPVETPPSLRRLLRRCLERDRSRRLWDLSDAILELDDFQLEQGIPVTAPLPKTRRLWPFVMTALALGAALGVLGAKITNDYSPNSSSASGEPIRFHVSPPEGTTFDLDLVGPGPAVLSPDGRRIAYSVQGSDRKVQIWLRDLGETVAKPVEGTDDPQYPFWSADGKSLGFFGRSSGMLHRLDFESGKVGTLAFCNNGKGGSWNQFDQIIYSPDTSTPIWAVSADGDEPRQVTHIDPDGDINSHRHPSFLPDGNRFLYLARSATKTEARQVRMGSLDGSVDVEVIRSEVAAVAVDDLLLLIEGRGLVARRFNAENGSVGASLGVVASEVSDLDGAAKAVFDATADTLVFLRGEVPTTRQLRWHRIGDAAGVDLGEAGEIFALTLAPNGHTVVVSKGDEIGGTQDLWLGDIGTGTGLMTRLTSGVGEDLDSAFSADGSRLYFSSARRRDQSDDHWIFELPLDRSSPPRLVAESRKGFNLRITDVGAGDNWLVASEENETDSDVVAIPLDGQNRGGVAIKVAHTEFREHGGVLSPSADWLAFVSYESGEPQVFVTPFPEGGSRWPVAQGGGIWPRWPRPDRLVYQDLDGSIWALPIELDSNGPRVGEAILLAEFDWVTRNFRVWDVDPEFKGVLALGYSDLKTEPMTVVRDWQGDLEAR